ncbi:GTPase-associated system all-helical protein GASH [Cupriavidus necator]|uniref:GTPase-associated system all-helical protein GASH n=1 Tax=Cupriavidus necator TaxID=106590 RepID=UPI003ECDFE28
MSIMAKYARIFWAEPSDADVAARNRSVAKLRAEFGALDSRAAISVAAALVDALAGAQLSPDLSKTTEKAISDESPAFQMSGHELQGVVCAAVAALDLARGAPFGGRGWSAPDAMAAALWSGLALQPPLDNALIEVLRKDLHDACRDRVRSVARQARDRQDVPDVGKLTIPEGEPAGARAQTAYKRATEPVIKALKENADLDREEIDFLWWALGDHSGLFDCPLAEKAPFSRAIAVGIEGALKLRRLPSDGHRHVVLRQIGESESLTLEGLVGKLAEDKALLAHGFVGTWAMAHPSVFPLICALPADAKLRESLVSLDARDWGARALLEGAIISLEDKLGGTT